MRTKFTPEICEEIIVNYENGLPLNQVAARVGIDTATLWRWRNKGKKAKSGKYRQFYLDMEKARANFIAFHLDCLNSSNNDNTHIYLLKVTDPEHFSEKNQIEHSGQVTNVNKNIEIDHELLDQIISEKRERYSEITDSDEESSS